MFSEDNSLRIGPVRCAWRDYRRGQRAEALVRPWLAAQLRVPSTALDLQRDAFGRPQLVVDGRSRPFARLDTNWSHSGDGLLVALGDGVDVGVDIEWLRPRAKAMALAERFFAPVEAAWLLALPPADGEAAFVRLWCAKEAVLKAHGHGISFGLHRLTFAPVGDDWRLIDCDPTLGAPDDWTLHAFAPWPGYRATLAWRRTHHDA